MADDWGPVACAAWRDLDAPRRCRTYSECSTSDRVAPPLHGVTAVLPRVLVVDDDAPLRELVRTLLERAGFGVHEAASAEEALALDFEPGAAVIDVRLPGVSGYELCRDLRIRFGDALPIIFMSGTRTEGLDRVAGLLIGADDYLVKPFEPEELLGRLRRLTRATTGSDTDRPAPDGRLDRSRTGGPRAACGREHAGPDRGSARHQRQDGRHAHPAGTREARCPHARPGSGVRVSGRDRRRAAGVTH